MLAQRVSCLAIVSLVGGSETTSSFTNPVISDGFNGSPDPGVGFFNGSWVMVTTGKTADGGAFAMRTSSDLVHWSLIGSVFTANTLPKWAATDTTIFWAPEIHEIPPIQAGSKPSYAVFFAANHSRYGKSVGVAVSLRPQGPYTDIGNALVPGVLPSEAATDGSIEEMGAKRLFAVDPGAIDPSFFHDDATGGNFLLWKDEGPPTRIYIRELAANGTSFAQGSSKIALIQNDQVDDTQRTVSVYTLAHFPCVCACVFLFAN
jgi:beta-xylosidase